MINKLMFPLFLVGLLLGFCSGFAIVLATGWAGALGALSTCEAELPRNQHCVIIAVPEQDKAYD